MTSFMINRLERNFGVDLNGDGYIGGEGLLSRLERATHIDFNGDNIIGRHPDVLYGHPTLYGYSTVVPRMPYSYGYIGSPYSFY